ncbi:MAG: helix-turn-helix transcriptional regulator [Kangiellaceae bacterium]|nr:helix-turn-helix transcriptional regulator [Kangiellaceae bacterium]
MLKRSHKQNCALAHAADILSERWTMLIIRELLLRPRRYGQLLKNLEGMGTNLLAARMKELIEMDIVAKPASNYQLTKLGLALEPSLLALIRWGFNLSNQQSDPEYLHRPEWDLLAMKSMFSGLDKNLSPLCMKFDSILENEAVWVRLDNDLFEFGFGEPMHPVDIDWSAPIAELNSKHPERLLKDSTQSNALVSFISAFHVS